LGEGPGARQPTGKCVVAVHENVPVGLEPAAHAEITIMMAYNGVEEGDDSIKKKMMTTRVVNSEAPHA